VVKIDPPLPAADFTLIDQNGAETHLSDWAGSTVLLSFGYTHCPDVCPLNLANYKRIKEVLGDSADGVRFVFVSVDGQRDTPERLNKYVQIFDPMFIALTGGEDAVRELIHGYNGEFDIRDAGGLQKDNYVVNHTASTFLIDGDGRWVRTYPFGMSPDAIADDIAALLNA
jgi:protein SCO1/2